MTGQQGGAPGQPGSSSPQDQESTQVGMPVPPTTPAYTQQPPQQPPTYGQAPGYPPPPPGYGGQPPAYGGQPPTYGGPPAGPPPGGYPPTGYGYGTPPPKRGGPSMLVLGAIALAVVLVLGVGGMYALGLGPFQPSATATTGAQLTPTPKPSKTPADSTATPTEAGASPTESAAPETTAPATTAPATLPPTAPATSPGFTFPGLSIPPTDPGASPSMSAADSALLEHVPEDLRDSCTPREIVPPAISTLSCSTGFERGIAVTYSQYPDTASMETAYEFQVQLWGGANVGNDQCSDTSTWPTELGYTVEDEPYGRLLCYELGTSPQIRWTDTKLNVLSWTFGLVNVTKDEIYDFWDSEAGPY